MGGKHEEDSEIDFTSEIRLVAFLGVLCQHQNLETRRTSLSPMIPSPSLVGKLRRGGGGGKVGVYVAF